MAQNLPNQAEVTRIGFGPILAIASSEEGTSRIRPLFGLLRMVKVFYSALHMRGPAPGFGSHLSCWIPPTPVCWQSQLSLIRAFSHSGNDSQNSLQGSVFESSLGSILGGAGVDAVIGAQVVFFCGYVLRTRDTDAVMLWEILYWNDICREIASMTSNKN